jgi:hypothetical protein
MSTQNLLNLKIHKVAQLPDTLDPTAIYLTPDNGHTHGELTNEGKLGTANYVVITDDNKKITTSSNISTIELGYLNGVNSSIQTQLDGKAPTSHASSTTTHGAASSSMYGHAKASSTTPKVNGTAAVGSETSSFARGDHVHPTDTTRAASSHVHGNITTAGALATASVVVVTDGTKTITTSAITTTELGYLDGVTSNIQTQLNGKSSNGHTHSYLPLTGGTLTGSVTARAIDSTGYTIKATTFAAVSDKRLKENLIEYKSEKSILDLPVYKYNFINTENKKEYIGCLAQDLQEICPEIVTEDKDGYLAIEESKIVYLLLEEVKKLKKELDALKNNPK